MKLYAQIAIMWTRGHVAAIGIFEMEKKVLPEKQLPSYSPENRAVEFLQKAIAEGKWKQGEKLPNYHQLARLTAVGHASMYKALHMLNQKKVIVIKRNVGIFLGEYIRNESHSVQQSKIKKHEHICEQLKKDIVHNQFGVVKYLPSLKELSLKYGAGYRVIQAAVDLLVHDGLLVHNKPRYRITLFPHHKSTRTFYLISNENVHHFRTMGVALEWITIFTRQLENECHHRNITIKRGWYSPEQPLTIDGNPASGFIVLLHPFDIPEAEEPVFFTMLRLLIQFDKPIVIVTAPLVFHLGFAEQLTALARSKKIYISSFSYNYQAGYDVGKFLLAKGHRQVCFFAVNHLEQSGFVFDRLKGLTNAFTSAGIQNGVVPLYLSQFLKVHSGIIDDTLGPLDECDNEIRNKLDERLQLFNKYQWEVRNDEPVLGVQASRLVWLNIEIMNNIQFLRDFIPLFRKALTLGDVTAWVCMDDYLANYGALEFLQAENQKISQKIEIFGFHDITESSHNEVTSYRFDAAGVAVKAMNLILFPRFSEKSIVKPGEYVFEMGGMVIDRGRV